MNSELLPFWELVLDGIQIFLCALIFLFLIHNKIKHKRWVLTAAPPKETIAFSEEIVGSGGMRLPKVRSWHMNEDGEWIANDEIESLN